MVKADLSGAEQFFPSHICFFEEAYGIPGFISGAESFSQRCKEAYRKNMLRISGKPDIV